MSRYHRPDHIDAAKRLKRWARRYLDMIRDPHCEYADQSIAEFADNVGVRPDMLMRAVREVGRG